MKARIGVATKDGMVSKLILEIKGLKFLTEDLLWCGKMKREQTIAQFFEIARELGAPESEIDTIRKQIYGK